MTMTKKIILALVALVLAVTARADANRATIRVACVGDSITYGAFIEDRETNCYPAVLGRMLGGICEVRNFGINGRIGALEGDYPYMKEPQYAEMKAWLPDVVVLMLGTNDSKAHNWNPDSFRKGLDTMVREIKALPSHPAVKIMLPPPATGTEGDIRESVIAEEVIPIIREVAKHHWFDVIDLHTLMHDRSLMLQDYVHPNAQGAEFIARAVYEELASSGLTARPGKRVVFIGDSITDGDWGKADSRPSADRNHYDMNHIYGHSYPVFVASQLLFDHPDWHMRFYNRGKGGDTLAGLAARWDDDVLAVRPDVVSILVGVNDGRGRDYATFDFAGWESTYRSLLDRTLAVNPSAMMVVCTPFYGGSDPVVERMASIVRAIAFDYGVPCVDFAAVVADLMATDGSGDKHYWLWDKIHPTPQAHRKFGDVWVKATRIEEED